MLRVDDSGRRRLWILGAVIALSLGGMVTANIVERYFTPTSASASEALSEKEMAAVRLEVRRLREFRSTLNALAIQDRWDRIVSLLEQEKNPRPQQEFMALHAEARLRAGQSQGGLTLWNNLLDARDPVGNATRLIFNNDQEGYRRYATPMIEHAKPQGAAMDANNTAWVAALAPDALEDYSPALALAQYGVDNATPEERPNYLNTLGVIQYRAGQYPEAIATLLEAEKLQSEAFNWPFLALAYQRTGNTETAVKYRDRLKETLNKTYATQAQQINRHELLLFYREVEAEVTAPSPATAGVSGQKSRS